jgi:hypothetical protein
VRGGWFDIEVVERCVTNALPSVAAQVSSQLGGCYRDRVEKDTSGIR